MTRKRAERKVVPFIRRGAETNDIWLEDLRGAVRNSIKDQGLTWKDIAELANLNQHTISKFAYGETKRPMFRTVFRIAESLGFAIHYTLVRG
jgi:DNA-binding phage protein